MFIFLYTVDLLTVQVCLHMGPFFNKYLQYFQSACDVEGRLYALVYDFIQRKDEHLPILPAGVPETQDTEGQLGLGEPKVTCIFLTEWSQHP